MNEHNWMDEIEQWIEEASRNQNIPIRKLTDQDARVVKETAQQRYVKGNPRVWWLDLARPIDEHYDRRSVDLTTVIPSKSGRCWLIPENERRPVYEVDVTQVQQLLDDCNLFEYNLVARDFSWLVAETDHDMLYICRDVPGGSTTSSRPLCHDQ